MFTSLSRFSVFAAAAALAMTTAMSPGPVQAQEQDPAADSLVMLWINSVGGMATYEAFESAAFTITTVLYDTLSGRVKRSRPRYVQIRKGPYGEESRVERWETQGFIEQGFNGRSAWASLDGELLPDSAKDSREAIYVARDVFYWMGLPFKLKDPGVFLTYHGLKKRPGAEMRADPGSERRDPPADYHAVGVSFGSGVGEHSDVFTYYFLPGQPLPTEVTYVEEGKTDLNRLIWGETRFFGDIRYPVVMERRWLTESGKVTKALVVSDVVINPVIDQARFEIPR